jgi:hypothetical protein
LLRERTVLKANPCRIKQKEWEKPHFASPALFWDALLAVKDIAASRCAGRRSVDAAVSGALPQAKTTAFWYVKNSVEHPWSEMFESPRGSTI